MADFRSYMKRTQAPGGLWPIDRMIGAKVRINSSSVGNFLLGSQTITGIFTIDKVMTRVSMDGKAMTNIYLKEIPDRSFIWRDLEILEIGSKPTKLFPNKVGCAIVGCSIIVNKEFIL